jgi:hypothetical protein
MLAKNDGENLELILAHVLVRVLQRRTILLGWTVDEVNESDMVVIGKILGAIRRTTRNFSTRNKCA